MSSLLLDPLVPPASASAPTRALNPGLSARNPRPASGLGAHRTARRRPDRKQPSDAALLAQARAGDAAAFASVYDRHAAAAYNLARRMVHDPTAAQDVVQEAFLSLWRSDRYRAEKGSLRNFVLAIVRNRAIDALRKDRRRRAEQPSDDTVISGLAAADRIDDDVEQRDTQRQLRSALTTLPDAQHRALELAFFGGLTHREIALQLNEPIGTIKSRIRLGLQRLHAEINAPSCR
jgi:RNA polymerase sigma-70 factor, ECF subfamily